MTVFPLSWINLYSTRSISDFLGLQMVGAVLARQLLVLRDNRGGIDFAALFEQFDLEAMRHLVLTPRAQIWSASSFSRPRRDT